MIKRILKLINNERLTVKIKSSKACDSTSKDICTHLDSDGVGCTLYALDKCTKDYASCSQGADDTCGHDWNACTGAGATDIE